MTPSETPPSSPSKSTFHGPCANVKASPKKRPSPKGSSPLRGRVVTAGPALEESPARRKVRFTLPEPQSPKSPANSFDRELSSPITPIQNRMNGPKYRSPRRQSPGAAAAAGGDFARRSPQIVFSPDPIRSFIPSAPGTPNSCVSSVASNTHLIGGLPLTQYSPVRLSPGIPQPDESIAPSPMPNPDEAVQSPTVVQRPDPLRSCSSFGPGTPPLFMPSDIEPVTGLSDPSQYVSGDFPNSSQLQDDPNASQTLLSSQLSGTATQPDVTQEEPQSPVNSGELRTFANISQCEITSSFSADSLEPGDFEPIE